MLPIISNVALKHNRWVKLAYHFLRNCSAVKLVLKRFHELKIVVCFYKVKKIEENLINFKRKRHFSETHVTVLHVLIASFSNAHEWEDLFSSLGELGGYASLVLIVFAALWVSSLCQICHSNAY